MRLRISFATWFSVDVKQETEIARGFAWHMEAWVAETVLALSGIEVEQRRSTTRKRALTCVQSGAVSCQELFVGVAYKHNQEDVRHNQLAATNVLPFRQKQP